MKGESGLFLLYRSIDPASIYHNIDCNKNKEKLSGTLILVLNSLNLLDAFHRAQFFDQSFKFRQVVNHYDKISTEQSVVTVDIDTAQYEFFFHRDNAGQIVDNANVVDADDTQRNTILRCAFA